MTDKNQTNKKTEQWFLLRGLAREAGHWGRFIDDLGQSLRTAEVHTLEMPGTGKYRNMRAPLTISETATFVMREFQELRKPGTPVYVVANSLGAMVAIDWLTRDDEGIDGVVLINTSLKGCSPFYKRLWIEAYPYLVKALAEEDDEKRETHVLSLVSNRPEIRAETAREWASIQRERPIRRDTFARQLFAAGRFQLPAKAPQVPMLLLNSLADRMVHPSCSEAIVDRWRCELRRHPTAGHDLTLDAGPWAANAIAEWRSELSVSKKSPGHVAG